MNYWIVRPIINGFELSIIMYGSEASLKSYIETYFKCPVNYSDVNYERIAVLEQFGFKVYHLPYVEEIPKAEDNDNDS